MGLVKIHTFPTCVIPTCPQPYCIDYLIVLRDRLLDHLATDEEGGGGGEEAHHQRYSAHPQVGVGPNLSVALYATICLTDQSSILFIKPACQFNKQL